MNRNPDDKSCYVTITTGLMWHPLRQRGLFYHLILTSPLFDYRQLLWTTTELELPAMTPTQPVMIRHPRNQPGLLTTKLIGGCLEHGPRWQKLLGHMHNRIWCGTPEVKEDYLNTWCALRNHWMIWKTTTLKFPAMSLIQTSLSSTVDYTIQVSVIWVDSVVFVKLAFISPNILN